MSLLTPDPTTPETQSNAPAGEIDPANGTAPSWINELPEPLRAEKSLHKFSDDKWKTDLPKSYVELSRKLGSTVQIPKQDADPTEWEKLFSRLRPETAEAYELPTDGVLGTSAADLKKVAFENGLTVKQLKETLTVLDGAMKKASTESAEQKRAKAETAQETLKKDFGKEYEGNLALANKAFEHLFPGAAEGISASGLDNDPAFIKGLVSLGKRLGEDRFITGDGVTKPKEDPYDWMRERFKTE